MNLTDIATGITVMPVSSLADAVESATAEVRLIMGFIVAAIALIVVGMVAWRTRFAPAAVVGALVVGALAIWIVSFDGMTTIARVVDQTMANWTS